MNFKRFWCDHRYTKVRRWADGIFGLELWTYTEIQCIHCGKKKTITGKAYLTAEGKLKK